MRSGAALPWRVLDVQLTVALTGVGGLTALAGWWGTSHTATVGGQVPWTAVAVAGLLLAELGTAWLVLAGRLALRRRHGVLAVRLAEASDGVAADRFVVAGLSMTRYHRPGCEMVAGKTVEESSVEAQRRAGRRACQLCAPRDGGSGPG